MLLSIEPRGLEDAISGFSINCKIMDDEIFMRHALEAGAAVVGTTGENPAVGCVVVCRGKLVATGATRPPGGAHAEVVAVERAEADGYAISQCEVYVTLEPCSFYGRTPPCARLLAQKGPSRVVIALRDPHPKVSGAGILQLEQAGIEVVVGVLSAEATKALASWLERHSQPGAKAGV